MIYLIVYTVLILLLVLSEMEWLKTKKENEKIDKQILESKEFKQLKKDVEKFNKKPTT